MARLFSERAFLPNFIGKLPRGCEREGIVEAGEEAMLDRYMWKDDPDHSPLLRNQKVKEFYNTIDKGIETLAISQESLNQVQLEFRRGNLHEVRRIVLPLVRYLHRAGYNIVDLSGKHMVPRGEGYRSRVAT